MGRFARADGQPNYSDLKPERFDDELPTDPALLRDLRDNPPTLKELEAAKRRPAYATRGHANLKGR